MVSGAPKGPLYMRVSLVCDWHLMEASQMPMCMGSKPGVTTCIEKVGTLAGIRCALGLMSQQASKMMLQ